MNLLLQSLPFAIEQDEIYPSFRNMIQLELLWQDDTIEPSLKVPLALGLLYKVPPKDIKKALEGLVWFYSCGKVLHKDTGKSKTKVEPIYDFAQDAALIYAAFYQAYNINLSTISFLHWWEFQALFCALPEETQFAKVMSIRAMSLDGLEAKQKAYYKQLKKKYALKNKKTKQNKYNIQQWIDGRFKTAERMKNNGV